MKRLFVVWNRSYRTLCIVAGDANEALETAVTCKHIKRATQYRRFEDATDRALAGDDHETFGPPDQVRHALASERSGAYRKVEGVWTLAGDPLPAS